MTRQTGRQTDRQTVNSKLVSCYSQAGFLTLTVINPLSFYVMQSVYEIASQRIEEDFVMSKGMLNTSSIYSDKLTMEGVIHMDTLVKNQDAIGKKPTQTELENMKKVKAANDEKERIAREKAANDARIKRERLDAEKKSKQNPNYAALISKMPVEDFTFCNSPERLEYIFNSSNGYGFFGRMDNMGAAFIPTGGREINKNNFLHSVKVIFEETLIESIITVKRTEKDSKFTYKLIGEAREQDDRNVLIQSHLGKEKRGLNYWNDKEKTVKSHNKAIDELIKFVDDYSTEEFKAANLKKVRCNLKEIQTLIALIEKNKK